MLSHQTTIFTCFPDFTPNFCNLILRKLHALKNRTKKFNIFTYISYTPFATFTFSTYTHLVKAAKVNFPAFKYLLQTGHFHKCYVHLCPLTTFCYIKLKKLKAKKTLFPVILKTMISLLYSLYPYSLM